MGLVVVSGGGLLVNVVGGSGSLVDVVDDRS